MTEEKTVFDLDEYYPEYDGEGKAAETMSVDEALMKSLDRFGRVDLPFIISISGQDENTVITELKGTIYQNPLFWGGDPLAGWELADEYLSGNVLQKYEHALDACSVHPGRFDNNVKVLSKLVNTDLNENEIYITLGSPWVPAEIIDEFIKYMVTDRQPDNTLRKKYENLCFHGDFETRHDECTGEWIIPHKNRLCARELCNMADKADTEIYGTRRMNMLTILEKTLNMSSISISDTTFLGKTIFNSRETIAALERQKYMINTFKNWVWADPKRAGILKAAYCRKYCCNRKREFNGSFLTFPGMSKETMLYDYQKNAVARIIFSPNTLLAHDVGSGKTYEMIAAGMELRRLGKSKKNLYVVPNSIVNQWETLFHSLYPAANILVISNKNFDTSHRLATLDAIRNNDYDAIIMPYSYFDMLPISPAFLEEEYNERLKKLEEAAAKYKTENVLERQRTRVINAIKKLKETYKLTKKACFFDSLGIDTLFVDEAHNYKNVSLDLRCTGLRGVNGNGSKKCNDMMEKVHFIQRNGGKVIFATGTPVTNTLADLYVMQKYLQEGELEFQGVHRFDAWTGMYAERTSGYEISVDTSTYHLVTRFSRFCNIPELTSTLSSIIDFHKIGAEDGIPEVEGYEDVLCEGPIELKSYLKKISGRAELIRRGRIKPEKDNMLKLTTDGRKAALDIRLVGGHTHYNDDTKVLACANKVYDLYSKTRDTKSTQLIFCDIGTPSDKFNVYDELRSLLVKFGMRKEEIAFIHDADTNKKKESLFKDFNAGKISVLIGSTAKLGLGVNVQQKLIAIHHLDVPWRPSDMVQREGRILRQGNENKKVRIYRYITKASFDAYSWQLLEIKQRFISQIMNGKATMREGGDIDDAVLTYSEIKALAIGNIKIKQKVELENEIDRLKILQGQYIADIEEKNQIIANYPARIAAQRKLVESCKKDIEEYAAEGLPYDMVPNEERIKVCAAVFNAVKTHKNSDTEFEAATFQGFKVVIPALMCPKMQAAKVSAAETGADVSLEKINVTYYVRVRRNGDYYMEVEAEAGVVRRLCNLFEGLPRQLEKFEEALKGLENKLAQANFDVAHLSGGYSNQIETLKAELNTINDELGVA